MEDIEDAAFGGEVIELTIGDEDAPTISLLPIDHLHCRHNIVYKLRSSRTNVFRYSESLPQLRKYCIACAIEMLNRLARHQRRIVMTSDKKGRKTYTADTVYPMKIAPSVSLKVGRWNGPSRGADGTNGVDMIRESVGQCS